VSPVQPPNPRPNAVQKKPNPVRQPVRQEPRQPAQQRPKQRPKPKPAKDPWPQQTRQPVKNTPRQQQKQGTQTRPVVRPQNISPQVTQGACPAASSLGTGQCSGRVSDCWSVGQADADCIDNALCCFDGCANVCQGAGPRTPARPSSGVQSQAASKPFVRCPSAMKCVPKINCDFEGVMRNQVFDLTPEMEMLRVPLIPCVNREAGNVIDVCCRDPNYKDPWPDMQGGAGPQANSVPQANNFPQANNAGQSYNSGQANIAINARNNNKKNKKNRNSYG